MNVSNFIDDCGRESYSNSWDFKQSFKLFTMIQGPLDLLLKDVYLRRQ